MKPSEITSLINNQDVDALRELISSGILTLGEGKLRYADKKFADAQDEYWDKRQLVKKILLNSLYGAILNPGCRFFDNRIGQSTTLTGRQVAKHMSAKVNELITGHYSHTGKSIIYGDTDSELGTTIHQSSFGEKTIEQLFNSCSEFWNDDDKEYAHHNDLMVMSYDPATDEPYLGHINYIYRHKVTKDLYEIEDELGNTITVTADHSVMIERNGVLMEITPASMLDDDILISIAITGATGENK